MVDASPISPERDDAVALLAAMADALPWPLLCVAEGGLLLHGNRAALEGLTRGGPLQLTAAGQVVARSARRRPALRAALLRALAGEGAVLDWPGLPPIVVQPLRHASRGPSEPPTVLVAIAAPPEPVAPLGQ